MILNFVLFCSVTSAEDLIPSREVLLNNEDIEVVRLTYPPGTESGMHTHLYPNRSVYFIQGGKLELVSSDKETKPSVIDAPTGKILYLPTSTHNVRNIGATTVILLEHEIK